jgi:uncharacterized coiled-coil protein SlyX
MPDDMVEGSGGQPYPSDLEARVSRLEGEMSELRAILVRLEAGIARLDERMGRLEERMTRLEGQMTGLEERVDATLPHLATKEQVALLPTRTYMWGVLGVLITAMFGAFGAGLAAVAILH